MKQIRLGGKLPVSALAMGCMRLTDAKTPLSDLIGTALSLGINFSTTRTSTAAADARSFSENISQSIPPFGTTL